MKFKPGDTINYGGQTYRVRMAASVGFECDAKPHFYDLTNIKTGKHECLPIIEVDSGQKAVYENGEWQIPSRIEEVTPGEKVNTEDKTYWEQMGDKVVVSEEAKVAFDERVKESKKSFVSTLADLWSSK